jgi:ubiquinone/menaquinone biosynthesis C-methylase UbiE
MARALTRCDAHRPRAGSALEATVTTDLSARDAAAIPLWDNAYDASVLDGEANLWGDPPVPYAATAAALFAANHARVILDLPCGDGRNLAPLAEGAPIVIGGDTSPKAMAIAARVARRDGIRDRVVFMTTDAFSTGLLDESIDGIFCWDLLGHLTNAAEALREFYRVLSPGGTIVANVWTMNDCQVSDPNIREISPRKYIDHFDFYCEFYDRGDLDALLNSIGLAATLVEVARWWEPPHATYRNYTHEHESLIFTITKPAE